MVKEANNQYLEFIFIRSQSENTGIKILSYTNFNIELSLNVSNHKFIKGTVGAFYVILYKPDSGEVGKLCKM